MPGRKKPARKPRRRRAESEESSLSSGGPSSDGESLLSDGSGSEGSSSAPSEAPAPRRPSAVLRGAVRFDPRTSRNRRRRLSDDESEEERAPLTALGSAGGGPRSAAALLAAVTAQYPPHPAAVAQPESVSGCVMKPHQLAGLAWLWALYDKGSGGILGDEMGVGKTLQAIALVALLCDKGLLRRGVDPPVLVVAPLSCISGWVSEFKRFAPAVRCLAYVGDKEERAALRASVEHHFRGKERPARLYHPACQCLITTPELLLLDDYFLAHFDYPALVFDEAHRLKSCRSRLARALLAPKGELGYGHAPCRILLTGTALQNSVEELWSLLHIAAPRLFADRVAFCERMFPDPRKNAAQAGALRDILSRLMLRRLKREVLAELPPKTEYVLHCPLSPVQKQLYRWVLQKDRDKLYGKSPRGLQNIVMQLRKVCNHPYCFETVEPEPFELGEHLVLNAGKLSLLDRLLGALKAEGKRVLLFSQFTTMLDLLQDYMHLRGWDYERLDGSVRAEERYQAVRTFQSAQSDAFVFLLSTRAGGLGLNLTAASAVVLYDSDWNPHVDLQAQERTHRIGQTSPVTVYRLISQGTVEDIILGRALRKLALARTLLDPDTDGEGGAGDPGKASAAELLDLITAGLSAVAPEPAEGAAAAPAAPRSAGELVLRSAADVPAGESAYRGFLRSSVGPLLERAKRVAAKLDPASAVGPDTAGAHLVYDGTDYAQKGRGGRAGDEALRSVLAAPAAAPQDAEAPAVAEPDADALAEPQQTPEEAAAAREERRRERMKKAWAAAGYVSRAVPDVPELQEACQAAAGCLKLPQPAAGGAAAAADEGAEYAAECVVGDVMDPGSCAKAASATKAAAKGRPLADIVVIPVNNGGRWGTRGLFAAVDAAAPEVGKAYAQAGECKDLRLGDLHLLPAGGGRLVALAVVQRVSTASHRSGGDFEARLVDGALRKLRRAAGELRRRGAHVSVHLPRFGSRADWYAVEKLTHKHLRRFPVFIYYFPRSARGSDAPGAAAAAAGPRRRRGARSPRAADSDTPAPKRARTAAAEGDAPAPKRPRAAAPAAAAAAASLPATPDADASALAGAAACLVGDWDPVARKRAERLLLLGGAMMVDDADALAAAAEQGEDAVAVRAAGSAPLAPALAALRARGQLRVALEEEIHAAVFGGG